MGLPNISESQLQRQGSNLGNAGLARQAEGSSHFKDLHMMAMQNPQTIQPQSNTNGVFDFKVRPQGAAVNLGGQNFSFLAIPKPS